MASEVLERSVLPAGKVFIKEGEENARAYIIQNGAVHSFKTDGERKVKIADYGPGTIIGELGLMLDDPSTLSYETTESTTVVTVTRQDFQKRLTKTDKTVAQILDHVVKKISFYQNLETEKALDASEIDDLTLALVRSLVSGLSDEKKIQYEDAMLPHINGLIKSIKLLKSKEKSS